MFRIITEHDIPPGGYVYINSSYDYVFLETNGGCKYGYGSTLADTYCIFSRNYLGIRITDGHEVDSHPYDTFTV